jgi:hypothetical protein
MSYMSVMLVHCDHCGREVAMPLVINSGMTDWHPPEGWIEEERMGLAGWLYTRQYCSIECWRAENQDIIHEREARAEEWPFGGLS